MLTVTNDPNENDPAAVARLARSEEGSSFILNGVLANVFNITAPAAPLLHGPHQVVVLKQALRAFRLAA